LKIAVKARQIGFSFAATLHAVFECLKRKQTWIFLSKGERQSKLLMEKVQEHVQACGLSVRCGETTFFEGTLTQRLEARFPNGSVIYGLPANPDTARGYTGNVTLDEFAFHQDAAKVYSALYPTITRGYSLEVISTPNGQQGKFFELAKQAGLFSSEFRVMSSELRTHHHSELSTQHSALKTRWSGHKVSIYDAVQQGFAVDVDSLRAGCDDEETWLQEYGCEFLSDAANYIPMELIAACESFEATAELTDWSVGAIHESPPRDLYLGVDVGRKRDLTVAWVLEGVGDVKWTRAVVTMKGQTFETQEKAISDLIEGGSTPVPGVGHGRDARATVRRCCIDQSGVGMMLAERLQKKYGARVEPVQFTAPVKERLAPLVKRHFEERLVRIPDQREIRADLNAVKRSVTPSGNVRYDAERTEHGHADRFWALALALEAAASTPAVRFVEAGATLGRPVMAGIMERVL